MGKKHYNTTNNTPVATPGKNGVPYFGDYQKQGKVMEYRPAGYFRQGDAFVQTNKDGTHMYWSPSRQEYYRLTPTNAKQPTTSELAQGIGQAVGQVFSSFGTNKSPNVTPAAPPRQRPSATQGASKPSPKASPSKPSRQAAAQTRQQPATNADAGNVFIYLNDGSNRRYKLSEKEFNQKSYNLAR